MDPLLVKLIDNVFIVLINYIFSRVFIFLKIPKEYKKRLIIRLLVFFYCQPTFVIPPPNPDRSLS